MGQYIDIATAAEEVPAAAGNPNLARWVEDAEAEVLAFLNRAALVAPVPVEELHDGDGRRSLMLREYPVVSVEAVEVDGAEIGPDAYAVVRPSGILRLRRPRWFRHGDQNVRVAYTAGYPSLPGPIRRAMINVVRAIAAPALSGDGAGAGQVVSRYRTLDFDVSYETDAEAAAAAGGHIPRDDRMRLMPYRRVIHL